MSAADDGGIVRMSTSLAPVRDRVALWREAIGRQVMRLEVEALAEGEFYIDSTAYRLPGVTLTQHAGANYRTTRTRALLADGNDDVRLLFLREGHSRYSNRHGEQVFRPGNISLHWQTEPGCHLVRGKTQGDTIALKHKLLAPLVANLDDVLAHRRPIKAEALRLLHTYGATLFGQKQLPDFAVQQMFAGHLYDLAAVALGACPLVMEEAHRSGVGAARLSAIKADIARNLAQPDLSAEGIAARHHISPRYVRRLFEQDDTSLSAFVTEARLAQARALLTNPRLGHWPITTIAFEAGFANLSYFNRCFRNRYGCTPSEMRAVAGSA